jgi:prepilin-type N-terminal cleavage/methylation domain-containing protein
MRIKTKGFTLIELLVVIAIIGLLTTLATVAVRIAMDKAKIAKAQQGVDTIYNAITIMANDTDQWPGHQTAGEVSTATGAEICGPDATLPTPGNCTHGLGDSTSGLIADDTYSHWQGPYMSVMPLDPWQHEYFFDTNYSINAGNEPCACGSSAGLNCRNMVVVGSYGPDGLSHDVLVDGAAAANPSNACDDVIKVIIFQ